MAPARVFTCDANVSLQRWRCKNLVVQMSSNGYVMMRMLWCKHNLFKNSFYFQNEASSTPETKIFSKLDLLFMKSHFLFDLRLPKNWWSLLEISEWDIDLESDDLAQKDYFHNLVQQRGWHIFKALFWKMNSLKIKHLKKIHFYCLWIWQFDKR